jgi:putative FmdB family regulatory protein
MPIYEYRCQTCGEVFEAIRPMRESGAAPPCPACDAEGAEKLPSVFAAAGSSTGGGCGSGGGFG